MCCSPTPLNLTRHLRYFLHRSSLLEKAMKKHCKDIDNFFYFFSFCKSNDFGNWHHLFLPGVDLHLINFLIPGGSVRGPSCSSRQQGWPIRRQDGQSRGWSATEPWNRMCVFPWNFRQGKYRAGRSPNFASNLIYRKYLFNANELPYAMLNGIELYRYNKTIWWKGKRVLRL